MPNFLTTGCVLSCTFGDAPSDFTALDLPGKPFLAGTLPVATMLEIAPDANIQPFGMCESPLNPEVIAATAAAEGVLTAMPCEPVVATPWAPPAAAVAYGAVPLATTASRCMCTWGGMIGVEAPAALTVITDV